MASSESSSSDLLLRRRRNRRSAEFDEWEARGLELYKKARRECIEEEERRRRSTAARLLPRSHVPPSTAFWSDPPPPPPRAWRPQQPPPPHPKESSGETRRGRQKLTPVTLSPPRFVPSFRSSNAPRPSGGSSSMMVDDDAEGVVGEDEQGTGEGADNGATSFSPSTSPANQPPVGGAARGELRRAVLGWGRGSATGGGATAATASIKTTATASSSPLARRLDVDFTTPKRSHVTAVAAAASTARSSSSSRRDNSNDAAMDDNNDDDDMSSNDGDTTAWDAVLNVERDLDAFPREVWHRCCVHGGRWCNGRVQRVVVVVGVLALVAIWVVLVVAGVATNGGLAKWANTPTLALGSRDFRWTTTTTMVQMPPFRAQPSHSNAGCMEELKVVEDEEEKSGGNSGDSDTPPERHDATGPLGHTVSAAPVVAPYDRRHPHFATGNSADPSSTLLPPPSRSGQTHGSGVPAWSSWWGWSSLSSCWWWCSPTEVWKNLEWYSFWSSSPWIAPPRPDAPKTFGE